MKYVFLNENRKLELRSGGEFPLQAFELSDEQYAALCRGDELTDAEFVAWLENGNTPDESDLGKTVGQIIEGFKLAIQQTLDEAARAKGYDDIVSACSYAGYENVFQAEAIAFGQWRANVWAYGYAELDKVMAGTRPVPTIPEILAELPALVLP